MNEYLSNEYLQSLLVLMIVTLFMILLKVVLSLCQIDAFHDFKDALYTLFREVVLVILGAALIQALNFYGLLKLNQDYTFCIFITIILWTLLGLTMILS